MSIAVFYGSTTGVTQEAAETIAEKLGADVYNVADAQADAFDAYDCLVLGSSTWGLGDLQDDWADFLPKLNKSNLSGKKVALFAMGDQVSYSDTYGDAIAEIHDQLEDAGVIFVGAWGAEGYEGEGRSKQGDKFLGLMLDDNNQSDMTAERIDRWVAQLKAEF